MDTKVDKPFFLTKNEGLGQAKPEDDLLHPEQNKLVMHESLTETQYFGFSIPEEKIHGIGYMWHHPNLHVVSGGVVVFQGFKVLQIAAELSDVHIFMSDDVLKDNLHDYRLANGYGVKVVEPLKRHHMTYSDPARKNSVDIHYEALQAPVMYGNGKHFEQALHAGRPMTVWPNIYFSLCLARWECEGMVAYGDFQEGIWNDYANLVSG